MDVPVPEVPSIYHERGDEDVPAPFHAFSISLFQNEIV